MTGLPLQGGFCLGPLFVINKRRMPKRYGTRMQGRLRRECERQATPPWSVTRDRCAFYKEAKRLTAATGRMHVVDHIVPLLHPLVCGLHCETNLQVLTYEANGRKSNNWWPNMPNQQLELFT